jgi:hypothetical protein
MRATGTRAWSLTAAVIALALGGSVGLAAAQARPAADSVAEEATKSVRETAKGIRQDPDGGCHGGGAAPAAKLV